MEQENIKVNLKKEIERARKVNYANLFEDIKTQIVKANINNIDLVLHMMNNSLDEMTADKIRELKQNGKVDKMFILKEPIDILN